jgi:hypothetical protein
MEISADFDMWSRLAEFSDTGFIPEPLIQLRDHGGQLSRNKRYYLNHVREDLAVYRKINEYADPDIKAEGRTVMRKHKLLFYYTLMLKALLNGSVKEATSFYKELAAYDNFFKVTVSYFKSRLKKPAKPSWIPKKTHTE